jgi:hypothetical protein
MLGWAGAARLVAPSDPPAKGHSNQHVGTLNEAEVAVNQTERGGYCDSTGHRDQNAGDGVWVDDLVK